MRAKFLFEQNLFLPICIFLIVFLSSHDLFGTEVEDSNKFNGAYLRNMGKDFVLTLKSPGRWNEADWMALAAVTGAGVLLFTLDKDIRDWVQKNRGKTSEDVRPYIRPFGKGGAIFGLLSGFYLAGEIFDRDDLRKTGLMGLESWLTAGSIVMGIKLIAGRSRPKTGKSYDDFHLLAFSSRRQSFPSGDAASAFALATVIAGRNRNLGIDILAYGLAGLVGVYRVHDDSHWLTDVFIGSVIGYAVGRKILSLYKIRDKRKHPEISLLPWPGGMTCSLNF